jgi:hypothetical protein
LRDAVLSNFYLLFSSFGGSQAFSRDAEQMKQVNAAAIRAFCGKYKLPCTCDDPADLGHMLVAALEAAKQEGHLVYVGIDDIDSCWMLADTNPGNGAAVCARHICKALTAVPPSLLLGVGVLPFAEAMAVLPAGRDVSRDYPLLSLLGTPGPAALELVSEHAARLAALPPSVLGLSPSAKLPKESDYAFASAVAKTTFGGYSFGCGVAAGLHPLKTATMLADFARNSPPSPTEACRRLVCNIGPAEVQLAEALAGVDLRHALNVQRGSDDKSMAEAERTVLPRDRRFLRAGEPLDTESTLLALFSLGWGCFLFPFHFTRG